MLKLSRKRLEERRKRKGEREKVWELRMKTSRECDEEGGEQKLRVLGTWTEKQRRRVWDWV